MRNANLKANDNIRKAAQKEVMSSIFGLIMKSRPPELS